MKIIKIDCMKKCIQEFYYGSEWKFGTDVKNSPKKNIIL